MNETSTTARRDGLRQARRARSRRVQPARRGCAPSTRPADRRAAPRPAVRGPRREHRRGSRRAATGQSVKPPVRGADVQADALARIDPERVEGAGQLLAAARDVRRRLGQRRRGVAASTRSPGLRSRARAVAGPTRTWPASSSACARVRLGGEAALDDQLVQADCGGPAAVVRRSAPVSSRAAVARRDGPSSPIVSSHLRRRCPSTSMRRRRRRSATDAVVDEVLRRQADELDRHRARPRRRVPASASASSTRRPEAARDDALLERDHELPAARLRQRCSCRVERLDVARVDHADRPAVGGQRGRPPPCRA